MVDWEELRSLYADPDTQIWDTRRPGEYSGSEETDNQRRGHLPGARNLVWTDLLTRPASKGEARFLKPLPELKQALSDLGLDREKTVITYCQSGIRAAFCILALTLLGFPRARLYDGSMAEWANLTQTPLVEGP
jgi:thiosulfate/3-mercaptopyruvate sulfurtransferase